MKNKKCIIVTTLSLATVLLVGVCSFVSEGKILSSFSIGNDNHIVEGTITIGQGGNDASGTQEAEFLTSNNNLLSFSYSKVVKGEDKHTLQGYGYISNLDAMHGIYRIDIHRSESNDRYVYLKYGFDNVDEEYDNFLLSSNISTYEFTKNKPNYLEIINDYSSGLEFTKIVIYYSCAEPQQRYYSSFNQIDFEGLNHSDEDVIFANTGLNLSNINTSKMEFHGNKVINGEQANNITITYVEDELKNSTTVIEGEHEVAVSFTYGDYTYTNLNNIKLCGYDHYNASGSDRNTSIREIKIQNNDNVPNDATYEAGIWIDLYDSNDNYLSYIYSTTGTQPLTNDNFITTDPHPFSTAGDKSFSVMVLGISVSFTYFVYDPEVNNIKNVTCQTDCEVELGTSKEEFLNIVNNYDFDISYYEEQEGNPSSVKGSELAFTIADDAFDVDELGQIYISFSYKTYHGFLSVDVFAIYTNSFGVQVYNDPSRIKRIEAHFAYGLFYHTVDGSDEGYVETVCYSYGSDYILFGDIFFRFSYNNNSKTFGRYIGDNSYNGVFTVISNVEDYMIAPYIGDYLTFFTDGFARMCGNELDYDAHYNINQNIATIYVGSSMQITGEINTKTMTFTVTSAS